MGDITKSSELRKYLSSFLQRKKVLILGFGKEGSSTLQLLHDLKTEAIITIADRNDSAFAGSPLIESGKYALIHGADYLNSVNDFDVVIKSPGISLKDQSFDRDKITSQTNIFLKVYGGKTIGVTGTKGKSTTSSLIYHIIKKTYPLSVFGGNIGTPLFDLDDEITPESYIVCELSSHQLEFVKSSPHIALLLNIYQEHLDHYNTFIDYQKAKLNIAYYQKAADYFLYSDEVLIRGLLNESPTLSGHKIPFDANTGSLPSLLKANSKLAETIERITSGECRINLVGEHNKKNTIIAAVACHLSGVPIETIEEQLQSFQPLEHRMEPVGIYEGKTFYNDSISTIPESAIAAIKSLYPVDTIILGGFDRGIDYSILVDFLMKKEVKHIVTTGPAGKTIYSKLKASGYKSDLQHFDTFDKSVEAAIQSTAEGGICLLSPAASSYNEFKNFEFRGRRFKELVTKISRAKD